MKIVELRKMDFYLSDFEHDGDSDKQLFVALYGNLCVDFAEVASVATVSAEALILLERWFMVKDDPELQRALDLSEPDDHSERTNVENYCEITLKNGEVFLLYERFEAVQQIFRQYKQMRLN